MGHGVAALGPLGRDPAPDFVDDGAPRSQRSSTISTTRVHVHAVAVGTRARRSVVARKRAWSPSSLVLLLPVIVLVTQRSELKLMRVAIPALAGLSVLHGLIPPHPGPLIAIAAVHAQLGTTLALGIVVAIPTVILCGPLLSILIAGVVPVGVPAYAGVDTTAAKSQHEDVKRPPSFGITLATIIFPVVLMLSRC